MMKKKTFFVVALPALGAVGVLWFILRPERPRPDPAKDAAAVSPFLPAGWIVEESKREVLKEIYLPFLHKEVVGKEVLVARIQGPGIVFKGPKREYKNDQLTKGTVIVLAKTGQLLAVEVFDPTKKQDFPGKRSLESTEEAYRSSFEKYEALPPSSPQLTLQEVFGQLYSRCLGRMEQSSRIEVLYVVGSRIELREPKPLWAVSCYGFPPYPEFGLAFGKVPPEERSYLRYLLSADGKSIGADNQP